MRWACLLFCLGCLLSCGEYEYSPDSLAAVGIIERFVEQRLAGSADFPSGWWMEGHEPGCFLRAGNALGEYSGRAYVRTQNAFGGPVKQWFTCTVRAERSGQKWSGSWRLVSLDFD